MIQTYNSNDNIAFSYLLVFELVCFTVRSYPLINILLFYSVQSVVSASEVQIEWELLDFPVSTPRLSRLDEVTYIGI